MYRSIVSVYYIVSKERGKKSNFAFNFAEFHRNCVNTGKIGKFLCIRFHFVKFEIYFLGLP